MPRPRHYVETTSTNNKPKPKKKQITNRLKEHKEKKSLPSLVPTRTIGTPGA